MVIVSPEKIREVCKAKDSLSLTIDGLKVFLDHFVNMMALEHKDARIPPISEIMIMIPEVDRMSIMLSHKDGTPYVLGFGETFPDAMENLFFNFFHVRREGKSLSKKAE